MRRKVPSLVDLCVRTAIDNIKYLGDVGETDHHLLDRILSHCNLDELKHIEDSTQGSDLSPVTDKMWKKFYKVRFGADSTDMVVERMRKRKTTVLWRLLYEAKLSEMEQAEKESVDRMTQRYREETARKQSRQVKLCSKVPPSSSRKRSFFGGVGASNIYNTKSSLMKKAKIEFVNSREVKNIAAMKNKMVHRNHSVSSTVKPLTSGYASSSSKLTTKPFERRF
ncbi:hypothetical protein ABFS83_08G204900 [Erythranthe nasuta]